ncbi:hypothetical protein SKAU_G00342270 [Synaphobranchus kaupii]|uniref:Uncharacterized protein n=1 Tax=Synaphobranchus kaupii TaxID=118154 RepID=A0A9Q1EN83_SYNKA|nr:hypothetical protein SKAU_G00342270 [Synaphobranchus kaupii]
MFQTGTGLGGSGQTGQTRQADGALGIKSFMLLTILLKRGRTYNTNNPVMINDEGFGVGETGMLLVTNNRVVEAEEGQQQKRQGRTVQRTSGRPRCGSRTTAAGATVTVALAVAMAGRRNSCRVGEQSTPLRAQRQVESGGTATQTGSRTTTAGWQTKKEVTQTGYCTAGMVAQTEQDKGL